MSVHFTQWLDYGIDDGSISTKRLLLNSGISLSIQASHFHYCEPRTNIFSYAGYDSFEIGYPSVIIKKLLPYAERNDEPIETVYGYVPYELLNEIINDNGGVKGYDEILE